MTLNDHFHHVHAIILRGRTRALAAATFHSMETYWQVGAYLSGRLSGNTYGKNVVNQCAVWLQATEPGIKGYDWRSLYRMREFFEQWQTTDWALMGGTKMIDNQSVEYDLHLPPEKLGSPTPISPPMPAILTRLSWSHHIVGRRLAHRPRSPGHLRTEKAQRMTRYPLQTPGRLLPRRPRLLLRAR